jgi:hypothetical protein
MTKKTLPLLLAGLLVSAGAFAQSSSGGSGDSAATSQAGSPSQSLQSSGSSTTVPGSSSMDSLPGTAGGSSSSSTGTLGAGRSPDIVVVQPAVAVPVAVPVYVQRDSRSERYTGNRAVDTGNGTLESNMGPYDQTWRNTDRSRSGSY